MQLDLIFSFHDAPQQHILVPFQKVLFKDKKVFFEFATSLLTDEEKETLVKISCCVYWMQGYKLPQNHWYDECDGKFYDCHITPLMAEIWNIKTTYEPINKL